MSIKRFVAAAAASVVAVSAMAISASAIVNKVEPITLDSKSDSGKLVQYNLALFDVGGINTVQILGNMPAGDWYGGGGGIGFDSTDGWKQVDFNLGDDDAYKVDDSGNVDITVNFDGASVNLEKEDGLFQIGWWWGSADVLNITDILVNGESIMNKEAGASAGTSEDAAPTDPAPADPEPAPADPEPAPADPEPAPADPAPATTNNVDTGVEGVAAVLGVAAVAAGAMIVAKKRK